VAGEFRAGLDTLFTTLDDTQASHVFCAYPTDAQLPNQLEGLVVKSSRACGNAGNMHAREGVLQAL
jgi:chitin synthase